jgi:hypothetical protein
MAAIIKSFFSRPFVIGIGSILDLAAAGYRRPTSSLSPEQQDADAIRRDWTAVGRDLWSAMNRTARENGNRGQAG